MDSIVGFTPLITVAESTPTSYILNFSTDEQNITSPNLMAAVESYNIDLSAAFSSIDIPVGELVLIADNVSTSAIRLSIRSLPEGPSWSMCEIRTFASAGGARTSICIDWIDTGVTFQIPGQGTENA